MADVMQVRMWLTDENYERCTSERSELMGYSITYRHVSEATHVCERSWFEETTKLWTLGEVSFDVPMGVRATHVMVQVGDHKISDELEPCRKSFPSPGVVNVGPLSIEVKERQ